MSMKICYFGLFDQEYERNRVLISGLRQNGVDVTVCAAKGKGFLAYARLLKSWCSNRNRYDLVIVGYSDMRFSVVLARILFRCPLVWDAFYSVYDSYVFDRKLVSRTSVKALWYWLADWLYCKIASFVLLDTNVHIDYFVKTFHVKKAKCIRSFVGASDDIFYQITLHEPQKGFHVFFFGKFIPLQGIQFIIQAAKLLEHDGDICFDIVGSGQTYQKMRKLAENIRAQNITFYERQTIRELARSIAGADICLGIFGDTGKAQRVIPNKAYAAIAMGKPLISADTPAMRELFTDREDILFCRAANPEDLAEKIRMLRDDQALRVQIAEGGHRTYQIRCTPAIIGAQLLGALAQLL